MPATAADLKFMASKTMLDTDAGGGARASTVLQTGASNSIFPDVAPADRLTGRTSAIKVYTGPLNADTAAVQSAAVMVDEAPTDPNVTAVIWSYGGSTTTRAQAVQALRDSRQSNLPVPSGDVFALLYRGPVKCWWVAGSDSSHYRLAVLVAEKVGGVWTRTDFKVLPDVAIELVSSSPSTVLFNTTGWGAVQTVDSGATGYKYRVSVSEVIPPVGLGSDYPGTERTAVYYNAWPRVPPVRAYGAVKTTAAVDADDDVVLVAMPALRVAAGSRASPDTGFPPFAGSANLVFTTTIISGYGGEPDNHVPVLTVGDTVTLFHEAALAAAAASNGQTVNVGRTNLDELAVVGANGLEIARFLRNGPSPGASCTADLDAGTVTFVNVTGYSQPVTVKHRIAHTCSLARVSNAGVGLSAPVTRAFPAGSYLSSHMPVGTLAARVENVFSQGAWTKVWSDAVIGNPIPLLYSGTIAVTNQGAESDRWAIVMGTDGDSFKCYSELLGQVGSGSVSADFSPINPATGAPAFTLYAASWAVDLPVNGVLRFNTVGASVPIWAARCVQPGAASASASMAIALLGGVDA